MGPTVRATPGQLLNQPFDPMPRDAATIDDADRSNHESISRLPVAARTGAVRSVGRGLGGGLQTTTTGVAPTPGGSAAGDGTLRCLSLPPEQAAALLENINPHPLDSRIKFRESDHKQVANERKTTTADAST